MKGYLFFIEDYLKGKPVFPVIGRILSILFSVSISSFIFEKFYFKYSWLNIADYKAMFDFFIKGYFFVPFSIFIVIHFFIESFSNVLFNLITQNSSSKLSQFLIELFGGLPFFTKWYGKIKESKTTSEWGKIQNRFLLQKQVTHQKFNLALKAIIVMTIYFNTISYFGWILYSLVTMALLIILICLWVSFLFLDALPSAIKNFEEKAKTVEVEK